MLSFFLEQFSTERHN